MSTKSDLAPHAHLGVIVYTSRVYYSTPASIELASPLTCDLDSKNVFGCAKKISAVMKSFIRYVQDTWCLGRGSHNIKSEFLWTHYKTKLGTVII